jgi:hypothetical protein
MQMSSHFSLRPVDSPDDAVESDLLVDGRDTGLRIGGRVIEAQYEVAAGTLLFITYDIPFEEQLDVVLLDRSHSIMDRASLFRANTTGSFRPGHVSGDLITFAFYGDARWTLRLLDGKTWRWPLSDPPGVERQHRWYKYFDLVAA